MLWCETAADERKTMIHRIASIAFASRVAFSAWADPIPPGAAASNVQAIGYSELGGRPGFKMSIRQVGSRWYLYMGHLWHFGWSIVDVTDPANPQLVKFIPGPDNTWT